ncbi:MAG: hypothetical protein MZV63_56505 [Marinilabiliales bacterium]|nr:hypothetical protein [Marinilabiliales bacterium]
MKRGVLYAANFAVQRHMADLQKQQMVQLAMADMMMEAYAVDSAVARARQLARELGRGQGPHPDAAGAGLPGRRGARGAGAGRGAAGERVGRRRAARPAGGAGPVPRAVRLPHQPGQARGGGAPARARALRAGVRVSRARG